MKCYIAFLKQQFRSMIYYRFDFFIRILYSLIAMYGARCLWATLYAQNSALLKRDLPSMITYAMLAMALDMMYYPSGDNTPYMYISNQIRSGKIDTDLLRPLGFQRYMLYRNSSRMVMMGVVLIVPTCIIGGLFMGMQLPASPIHALFFIVSAVIGYFVLFAMNYMLGLLSILTLNIRQIAWAYNGLLSLLSGKLIPIWMFPAGAHSVMQMLPFRCIFDIPLNIYTGALQTAEIAKLMLFQLIWAIVLMLAGQLIWRGIRTRLAVQGG